MQFSLAYITLRGGLERGESGLGGVIFEWGGRFLKEFVYKKKTKTKKKRTKRIKKRKRQRFIFYPLSIFGF